MARRRLEETSARRLVFQACVFAASLALIPSCAGRSRGTFEDDGRGGAAGTPGGAGGASGGSRGRMTGDDACAPLGNDPNRAPGREGCYAFEEEGWVRIPCRCEVMLENVTFEPTSFILRFKAYDGPVAYAPNGQIAVSFDDEDRRFFDLWAAQPENGTAYVVTHDGVRTELALEDETVLLPRALLEPCEARSAKVTLNGSQWIWLRSEVEQLTGDVSDGVWISDCNAADEPPPP